MNHICWVYMRSEPNLYTVGYYGPNGEWRPESDYVTADEAAHRVHYLNGGTHKVRTGVYEKFSCDRCDYSGGSVVELIKHLRDERGLMLRTALELAKKMYP